MITIEQLNAIPGRPDYMTWADESRRGTILRDDLGVAYSSILDGAVEIWIAPHDDARMLYSFATYIRRVEIEIERESKGLLYAYGDDGYAQTSENDVIEEYISGIGKLDLEDGCCEIELTLCKPMPISAMLPSVDQIAEMMNESIASAMHDADDDDVVEVLDGAKEALNVWAGTYLRYRRGFPCENEGEKIVKVRVTESGWEEVE